MFETFKHLLCDFMTQSTEKYIKKRLINIHKSFVIF